MRFAEDLTCSNLDLTSYNNCFKPHSVDYKNKTYIWRGYAPYFSTRIQYPEYARSQVRCSACPAPNLWTGILWVTRLTRIRKREIVKYVQHLNALQLKRDMATYFFIISFGITYICKIICKSPSPILRNFIISWDILTEKITNQRAFRHLGFWRICMLRHK